MITPHNFNFFVQSCMTMVRFHTGGHALHPSLRSSEIALVRHPISHDVYVTWRSVVERSCRSAHG